MPKLLFLKLCSFIRFFHKPHFSFSLRITETNLKKLLQFFNLDIEFIVLLSWFITTNKCMYIFVFILSYYEAVLSCPQYNSRSSSVRYYRNYRYPVLNSGLRSIDEQDTYSDVNIRNRMRIHKQERQNRRTKLLPAIHFHGDTSRYVYGEHENYNGKF